MQTPVAIASATNGMRHEVYLVQITVATVNAFVVCPDGKPWLVGFSKRAVIPRVGSWKGRGSPNESFRISVSVIADTMAGSITLDEAVKDDGSALVQRRSKLPED